ncbi:MAG: hypothetical protein JXM72_00495 [Deltaproteobacteria bacterium]|nr:hypothetical protein [Deltaproteobacteria bacterium]
MKIFGQPADYSEILQRVFWFSFATGILCTVMLAKGSPAVQALIDSVVTEADIGPIKGIKVLYVLIPGVIAVFSRVIKLHDRISDVLRIRFIFDTRYFLYPLCQGVGLELNDTRKAAIDKTRDDSMYQTVYKYAGFRDPMIDVQLVRTAADNWGWFWVLVESSFLFLTSAIIFACISKWNYMTVFIVVVMLEIVFILFQWLACIKSAAPQVQAILSGQDRSAFIRNYFERLTEGENTSMKY